MVQAFTTTSQAKKLVFRRALNPGKLTLASPNSGFQGEVDSIEKDSI